MRIIGLFIIVLGIIYLIYSILFRNQVTIYNKDKKMVIHNMNSYLKLQLYFSFAAFLYFVIMGVITTLSNIRITYVVLSLLIFHSINYLFKIVSKKKGYISIISFKKN